MLLLINYIVSQKYKLNFQKAKEKTFFAAYSCFRNLLEPWESFVDSMTIFSTEAWRNTNLPQLVLSMLFNFWLFSQTSWEANKQASIKKSAPHLNFNYVQLSCWKSAFGSHRQSHCNYAQARCSGPFVVETEESCLISVTFVCT